MLARGSFEVKVIPQPEDGVPGGSFARLLLDKTFRGDLEGTSKGQMLASGGPGQSSGAYVALERVTGTLGGKSGSFVLQHRGTMHDGAYALDVSVAPGSGTEELADITGAMRILVAGADHSYEFDYSLGAGDAGCELTKLEQEWARAFVENDAKTIGRYMADDWVVVSADGSVVDRTTFLGLIESGKLTHDRMEFAEVKVRTYGDSAVVTARASSSGRYRGEAFSELERSTDVFVKHEGQWKSVVTLLTRIAEKA